MGYEIAGGVGVKMAHPDREVVVMLGDGSYMMMNSELATCFLEQYDELAEQDEPAIVVDLSDCPGSRGIVEALPSANLTVEEPDTEFMISPEQLSCLKKKLEDPDIELDPTATIDLGSCV